MNVDASVKTVACPSTGGHWWDCPAGRAMWRNDSWSDSPAAAGAVEEIRALQTGDYTEPVPAPDRWEVA